MLLTSTRLGVLTGAAMLAGGIAFADSGIDSLRSSLQNVVLAGDRAAPKGDRLTVARTSDDRTGVSIVEIVGLSHATVILRGDDGEVLYRSDPRSGITTIAKNTEVPALGTRDELQAPVPHPPVAREGNDEPRKQNRRPPVGCMGDVSPLASASANRMPSLCLASLDRPVS